MGRVLSGDDADDLEGGFVGSGVLRDIAGFFEVGAVGTVLYSRDLEISSGIGQGFVGGTLVGAEVDGGTGYARA
jgi:hypothetical protein